jgi:hypothetical protein
VTATVALGASAWTSAAQAATKSPFPHEAREAGRWSLLIAALGLLIVLPLLLWILELLTRLASGSIQGLKRPVVIGWIRGAIIGTDKRVSTSKTVAVVWTYAVASALLSIVVAKWWGHDHAYNAQVKTGLQAGYALLIGGPLGAAILAKGIVSSQVAGGQSKPTAENASAADLVNNDQGTTDLGDLQYVLFNTVALTFFFGEFIGSPQLGLPTIPDVLLGLTSVSAVGYVSKKVLPARAREITKVDPSKIAVAAFNAGAAFKVFGSGLLNADGTPPPTVRFENLSGSVNASRVAVSTSAEGLVLDVDMQPNALLVGDYGAIVITAEGNKAARSKSLNVF